MSEVFSQHEIQEYLERLFPINRSLTGAGNRETLGILQEIAPIDVIEYPSGCEVFDWRIPDEWHISEGWIKSTTGEVLVDFKENNLHVVGYSSPIRRRMVWDDLKEHIHYLEEAPDAIPYRTSYYKRDWGFCVSAEQYRTLASIDGEIEVCIDSSFDADGSMSIGELVIAGKTDQEILVSTYLCHPSMANDNLSGLLASAILARDLLSGPSPRFTWRFVFVPETIGAISYLFHNQDNISNVIGGFVITCCGGAGALGWKPSYRGDHLIDQVIELAFRDLEIRPVVYPFAPDGSDERQYSSPGFRIPVGTITKDKYYEYPQYHTSLDNLDFVNAEQILESLAVYRKATYILENNCTPRSCNPHCEVRLGKHNLYPDLGGAIKQGSAASEGVKTVEASLDAISWILFLADGDADLVTIARTSGIAFDALNAAAKKLAGKGLITYL